MIKAQKTQTEDTFDRVHQMLCDYWKNIGINIFEWKRKNGEPLSTLSEGLTSQRIESYLYDDGKAIFVEDKNLGYLCLKALDSTQRNVYNEAISFKAIGLNYNQSYNIDNSVLIKNNALKMSFAPIINYYCKKLTDIELAKDVNRNANKTPIMIECDENTLLSAKNVFKQLNSNEPVILRNRNRGANLSTTVLKTDAPFIIDKLEDDYHNYEARILTIFGLDNYVEDKKERVQSAEVESQQEYIISNFRASLRERQLACEKINKMFGLDLTVDYVHDEQIETEESNEDIEVTENE